MVASRAADDDLNTRAVTLPQDTAWFHFSLDKQYSDITQVVIYADTFRFGTLFDATLLLMSSTTGGHNFTCARGVRATFPGERVVVDCSGARGSFQHVVLERNGANSELIVSDVKVIRRGGVLKHHASHGTPASHSCKLMLPMLLTYTAYKTCMHNVFVVLVDCVFRLHFTRADLHCMQSVSHPARPPRHVHRLLPLLLRNPHALPRHRSRLMVGVMLYQSSACQALHTAPVTFEGTRNVSKAIVICCLQRTCTPACAGWELPLCRPLQQEGEGTEWPSCKSPFRGGCETAATPP